MTQRRSLNETPSSQDRNSTFHFFPPETQTQSLRLNTCAFHLLSDTASSFSGFNALLDQTDNVLN